MSKITVKSHVSTKYLEIRKTEVSKRCRIAICTGTGTELGCITIDQDGVNEIKQFLDKHLFRKLTDSEKLSAAIVALEKIRDKNMTFAETADIAEEVLDLICDAK